MSPELSQSVSLSAPCLWTPGEQSTSINHLRKSKASPKVWHPVGPSVLINELIILPFLYASLQFLLSIARIICYHEWLTILFQRSQNLKCKIFLFCVLFSRYRARTHIWSMSWCWHFPRGEPIHSLTQQIFAEHLQGNSVNSAKLHTVLSVKELSVIKSDKLIKISSMKAKHRCCGNKRNWVGLRTSGKVSQRK